MAARIIWWVAVAAGMIAFADTLRLTFPRRGRGGRGYLVTRSHARFALGLVEASLVLGAFLLRAQRLGAGPGAALAGGLIALIGSTLAIWAKARLGGLFTAQLGIKEGHQLVSDGPYRIVRHPIYLGIVAFAAGSSLVWDRIAFLGLAACLAGCFLLQLRIEERLLADHFGAAYADYRRRVPALLPWPRPRRAERR